MTLDSRRLQREQSTIERMVAIWCRDRHGHGHGRHPTCAQCQSFLDYTEQRLARCPYGARKPTCARCPVHCYRHERREQARAIMRHAGPKMLLRHPWLTLVHLADKLRAVRHPMELRGGKRSYPRSPRA